MRTIFYYIKKNKIKENFNGMPKYKCIIVKKNPICDIYINILIWFSFNFLKYLKYIFWKFFKILSKFFTK